MESAIPEHLKTGRTRTRRIPGDYEPPYPSFVARHKPGVQRVVMAYFGVQYRGAPPAAAQALRRIEAAFAAADAPGHWDRAAYTDQAGWENVISIAYWDAPARFDAWFAVHGRDWAADAHSHGGSCYFTEGLRPAVERYEALFSAK